MTVCPLHEVRLEPGNTDPSSGPGNRYSFAWVACMGGVTSPDDRPDWYIRRVVFERFGTGTWLVFARKFTGDTGRSVNLHSSPIPYGWRAEWAVSPVAFDLFGGDFEVTVEPESADGRPYHFTVTPRSGLKRDQLVWYVAKAVWGRRDLSRKGEIHVWDITTRQKVVEAVGINTHYAGQTEILLWEGGYNSSGVTSTTVGQFAPSGLGRTLDEALADVPQAKTIWHSEGPTSSSLQQVGTVDRPDDMIRQVVTGIATPAPTDPYATLEAELAATQQALHEATDSIEQARTLCRQQITVWRAEKRSWAWILKQPAAQAFYGPLGGN